MTLPPPKACQRIRKLFAQMGSSGKDAEVARDKLNQLLVEHGLSWNDLPAVLAATAAADTSSDSKAGAAAYAAAVAPTVNVLDLVLALIEEHIAITAEERMAIALWVLHTWVFDRFPITPRLALLSPVRGCGKTTLLTMIELLVAEGNRTDSVTAAAIYYHLDRRPRTTLLIDEADNLDLFRNGVLRSVFNSGHRRGGGVSRFVGGQSRRFPTFAPLAIAAIGMLPLPLLHRAVVINMQRSGGIQLRRLDESDPAFPAAREQIRKWATMCSLAHDPGMPPALRDRAADNWRGLLAIADNLERGEAARSAAVALCGNRPDEDACVTLLGDIRTVFQARGVDRVTSLALIEALLGLEDNIWNEWRGLHDERPPRKLTQGELSRLLRPFGIRPKTIWPARRRLGDKSGRGYWRFQFEPAWRAYCPPADTSTQPNKIIQLPTAVSHP